MEARPVPILMFSSMTYEGARITLDALEAGAVDFIPKDFAEVSSNTAGLKRKLHGKLLDIVRSRPKLDVGTRPSSKPQIESSKPLRETASREVKGENSEASARQLKGKVNVLIIGASTGGPVALTEVLTQLPANFSLPILLVQHMPENFTKAFAERLNKQCKLTVKEAEDGDQLRAGTAILAPGGKQMMFDAKNRGQIKVLPGDNRVNYRPSVDITFGSAANVYGDKVLGIVLTGMGSDGCEGARLLKSKGSSIWSQDEASCVIYGMPMAVARANLSDRVLPLKEFGPSLAKIF
jgi:two-component system chemotaxis response regulator CheB